MDSDQLFKCEDDDEADDDQTFPNYNKKQPSKHSRSAKVAPEIKISKLDGRGGASSKNPQG